MEYSCVFIMKHRQGLSGKVLSLQQQRQGVGVGAGGGTEEEIMLLWLGRVFLIFHLQMKTIGPSEASRQGRLRAARMGWPLLRCTL